MEKVHALKWSVTGQVFGIYSNYANAERAAKKANLKRSRWRTWLESAFTGAEPRWVVQTFEVKD